ncbi:MAG: ABC transporter ATP-binding protein [Dehalococcoidia bacterium]|nr:ABC transporter ATP-binding protein [Dehalococcoidia bacterium]
MSVLQVQDLHTYYGNSYVLQGVSLEVEQGTVIAILGRNGVGKTTLIRSISGHTPCRQGHIFFQGKEISHMPSYFIARQGIGLVPQGRRVFPSLTVKETFQISARGATEHGWTEEKVLKVFPRLGERWNQRAGKLSGGEQQMLAIARALLGNPRLLLLDEPTEGLAPLLARDLGSIIQQIKAEGLSIVLVEQNLTFALALADYAYVMSKGRIVHQAPAANILLDAEVKARYLGV